MLGTRLVTGFSMVGFMIAMLCVDEWLAPWFPLWFLLALFAMGAASQELVGLLDATVVRPSANTVFGGSIALVVANWVAKFNTDRITFTFPVLNGAAEVMFLASGSEKAEIAREILEGKNTPPLPAQRVQPADGKLLWMLDESAAAKLTR